MEVSQEVEFKPDERALLDWLEKHAAKDGALSVTDTRLIRELGFGEEKAASFFAAKMRLIAAGALGMYIDQGGRQVLRLLMPERKHRRSKRYIFTVVPLEMMADIRKQVTEYRIAEKSAHQAARAAAAGGASTTTTSPPTQLDAVGVDPGASTGKVTLETPAPKPPPWHGLQRRAVLEQGRARLGVSPVSSGPVRPPLVRQQS